MTKSQRRFFGDASRLEVYLWLTRSIEDMYDGDKTWVRIVGGNSEHFLVMIGLQGCTRDHFLARFF